MHHKSNTNLKFWGQQVFKVQIKLAAKLILLSYILSYA